MALLIKAFILLFSFLASLTVAVSPIDLPALQALYNSANGASWSVQWDFGTDLCTNSASTVQCYADGRVRRLYLSNIGMTGSLPTEIGIMTKIDTLNLGLNSLTGSIPTEIGLLNATGTLILNYNQFTGAIPTEIGNMKLVQKILLEYNKLTGTIPTQVAQHPLANEMRFANNQLTGSLPLYWGPNVYRILSDNNQLSGTIPTELFSFPTLTSFRAQSNKLTGTIPTQIGTSKFFEFFVTMNQLSGPIPTQLGNTTSMQRLWIYGNSFSGTIPTEVGLMRNLVEFKAWNNQLTSTIPSQFGLINSLQALEIHNNQLSGSIPTEIGNCQQLISIKLATNFLTGHVPGPVIRLPNLGTMYLNNNCLSPLEPYSNIFNNDYLNYNVSTSCPLQGPYPTTALAQAPAFSYEFYSTALLADSSTSNSPLVTLGTASYISRNLGQYGNPFNGAVQISATSGYSFYSQNRTSLLGSFTVEVLMAMTSFSSVGNVFALSTTTTGASTSLRAQINSDGSITIYRASTIVAVSAPAGTIQINRIHHLLVTWDSANKNLYLYVDGVLKNSVHFTSISLSGTYYFLLANTLNVVIDEADVYRSLFGASVVTARVQTLFWCPAGSCLATSTCYPSYFGSTCT